MQDDLFSKPTAATAPDRETTARDIAAILRKSSLPADPEVIAAYEREADDLRRRRDEAQKRCAEDRAEGRDGDAALKEMAAAQRRLFEIGGSRG